MVMNNKLCGDLPTLTLIWHEAGNDNYQDRYASLRNYFRLDVLGPDRFMGKGFDGPADPSVSLMPAILTNHWLTYLSIRMLWRLWRRPADVLHVHQEPHSLTAFFACVFSRSKRIFLESSAINMKGHFRGWNVLERWVYRRVDCVLPKNPEVAQILESRGCPSSKLTAPVGNGVSQHSYAPMKRADAQMHMASKFGATVGESPGRLLIGYAGRIWEPKGLRLLAVIKRHLDVDVWMCGEVTDQALQDDLRAAGVHCFPALKKADLRCFYGALDLFVLPSLSTPGWREQFGRACAESIFCGTPAIGSRVGGIPMVVGSAQTFVPGSVDGLMALVSELSDQEKRHRCLEWQRSHIEKHFSWDAIAKQVRQIYDSRQGERLNLPDTVLGPSEEHDRS